MAAALPPVSSADAGPLAAPLTAVRDAAHTDAFALDAPPLLNTLGLYQGTSLADKQIETSGNMPDMVFIYRRPILDYWCETGEDLTHVVRHVLIHEIGHHFGLSDDDMEALEASVT